MPTLITPRQRPVAVPLTRRLPARSLGASAAGLSDRSQLVRRVYLIDDHPLVVEWLTTLIDRQPHLMVCGSAHSVSSAFEGIEQLAPDVAIVEMNLRGSCGVSLIKEIRRRSPSTAVLVFSMYEDATYAERALRAGALGYVTKRQPTQRLMAALDEVLCGKAHFSEEFKLGLVEMMLRRNGADSDISILSDRELEIFRMMGRGRTTRGVSDDLGISIKTVQVYCGRMKRKLGIHNANQLVRQATLWWEAQEHA
jgi:DNA-binding NarL/FixJ family response regulator